MSASAATLRLKARFDSSAPFAAAGTDVTALAFIPGNASLLSAAEGSVRRWSVADGREEHEYRLPAGAQAYIRAVRIANGILHVATVREGITQFAVEGGAIVRTLPITGLLTAFAVHAATDRLAVGTTERKVHVLSGDGTPLATFEGGSEIHDVAWARDGSAVYVAGGNFRAYAPDGRKLWEHTREVQEAWRILPVAGDEVLLAGTAAYGRGLVRIVGAPAGDERAIIEGHSFAASQAAVSEDGAILVTASSDRSIRVWDPKNRRPVATLRESTNDGQFLKAIALSSDGSLVASSEDRGRISLYRATGGGEILAGGTRINSRIRVAMTDGPCVAAAQSGELRFHDPTRVAPRTIPFPNASAIASAEGVTMAASTTATHGLATLDVASGAVTRLADGAFDALAISGNGRIAAAAIGHRIRTFDVRTRQLLTEFAGHPRSVAGWDLDTDLRRVRETFSIEITALALSTDGAQALSVGRPDALRHWETRTGVALRTYPFPGNFPRAVAFASRDRWALIADLYELFAIDLSTGERVWAQPVPGAAHLATREGSPFVAVAVSSRVELRLVATGERVDGVALALDSVASIDLSPDGRWVCAGTMRDSVRLYEITRS